MSIYILSYKVQKILHGYCSKIEKISGAKSMWYYDSDNKSLVICSTRPGLWIGYHGEDVETLRNKLAEVGFSDNIKFIECAI